jgi:hypothetical protein
VLPQINEKIGRGEKNRTNMCLRDHLIMARQDQIQRDRVSAAL